MSSMYLLCVTVTVVVAAAVGEGGVSLLFGGAGHTLHYTTWVDKLFHSTK